MKALIILLIGVLIFGTGSVLGYKIGRRSVATNVTTSQSVIPPAPPFGPPSNVPSPSPITIVTADLPSIASAVAGYAINNGIKRPMINFQTNDGTYAKGGLGEIDAGGGSSWFAAKINGVWTVVYVGQAPPKCTDVAKYNLPQSFLSCY